METFRTLIHPLSCSRQQSIPIFYSIATEKNILLYEYKKYIYHYYIFNFKISTCACLRFCIVFCKAVKTKNFYNFLLPNTFKNLLLLYSYFYINHKIHNIKISKRFILMEYQKKNLLEFHFKKTLSF